MATTKLSGENCYRFEEVLSADGLCFLCLEAADHICKYCSVAYCCVDHYAIHRDEEFDYCHPFRVLQKPEVGRYVVATRDLKPLEVIMRDSPAAFGPNHDTEPACLECLLPVNGEYLCEQCSLPLCGVDCRDGANHKSECDLFSKPLPTGYNFRVKFDRPVPEGSSKAIAPEYCCITPLRMLRLKKRDPSMWKRLQLLMDHDKERRTETEYQKMFQVNVVDFLIKVCGLDYTEEEIFKCIGILRTNAFHVEDPPMRRLGASGRVVYPTFSYLSHSCICNARYCVEPYTHKMTVRAQLAIKAGEEVTIQYISFMYGHLRRKHDIRSYWFFDCSCPRCLDATEMGSFMSAMRCSDCERGDLLPKNPSMLESDWVCNQCHHQQSMQTINDYCKECEHILCNTYEHDVEKYEKLLQEFSARLNPNHYFIMTVKKYLADLYGIHTGYQYNQLDPERLERKIKYYQEFLSTIGKVDPGHTKWKGQILYELHRPLLIKVNRDYECGNIAKDDFVKSLKMICDYLEESVLCLQPEADGTKEAAIAKLAKKALTNTKEIVLFSDFL